MEGIRGFLRIFKRSIPGSELTWSYATLRCIEQDIQSVLTHYKRCILKRLTITDTDFITTDIAYLHLKVLSDPVDF